VLGVNRAVLVAEFDDRLGAVLGVELGLELIAALGDASHCTRRTRRRTW
jgi:pheromone shutdown protein TraB